jgi:glucose-1-phosphate adenylyltransferase
MQEMNALGVLFSNIHDDDLKDLTLNRTTASVPFGGRYRLVDFILSNLVNANIFNVAIITKTNYHSLMDHLETGKAWDLNRKNGGLAIFPPFACNSLKNVYRGKLEALIGIKTFLDNAREEYIVLSDCNIVCNLDLRDIIEKHIDSDADITIVYHSSKHVAQNDLILKVDKNECVYDISIALKECTVRSNIGLGTYIIKRELLVKIVEDAYAHGYFDFEREYLQKNIHFIKICGYENKGYSAAINSISKYYKCNMDLLNSNVRKELFYENGKIYTKAKDTVPAKYGSSARVSNSLIADGTIIKGTVENSIIFRGVKIEEGACVRNSIIMQSTVIEKDSQLDYVITDKNVLITPGRVIIGVESYPTVIEKGRVV